MSATGRGTWGRVQENSECGVSSCPLRVKSWAALLYSHHWVTVIMEWCPQGSFTQVLVPETLLGLHHLGMIDCPHGLSLFPAPLKVRLKLWPKPPTPNHIPRLPGMAKPHPQSYCYTHIKEWHSKGLEIT